jgi:hypothetical protein
MQSKKYPLEKGGQPRLEISWKGSPVKCKHVAISVDGQEIGTIANQKLMEEGQEFCLQDGSTLVVKLNRGMLIDFIGICKWEISLNGEIIPDPDFEPAQKHKSAYGIVFFIAGFNIAVGFAVALFKFERFGGAIGGISMIIFGFIFLGLGFLVKRRSAIALGIAFTIFLLDTIYLAYYQLIELPTQPHIVGTTYSSSPNYWPYMFRGLLLYGMWQGFGAISKLKSDKA